MSKLNLINVILFQQINFDSTIIKQEFDYDDGYQGMRKVPSLSDVSDPDSSDGEWNNLGLGNYNQETWMRIVIFTLLCRRRGNSFKFHSFDNLFNDLFCTQPLICTDRSVKCALQLIFYEWMDCTFAIIQRRRAMIGNESLSSWTAKGLRRVDVVYNEQYKMICVCKKG